MNQAPHNFTDLIKAAVTQQNQTAAQELAAMDQACRDYKKDREARLRPFILAMNEIKDSYPKLHCSTSITPWHHNGKIICNDVIGFRHPKYNDGKVSVAYDGQCVCLNVTYGAGYETRTLATHTNATADALIPEFIHLLAEAIRHLKA